MNAFMNILQGQLDKVKQSNKHFVSSKDGKQKLSSSVILATNIVKLEAIVKEAINNLELEGVDIDRCRQEAFKNKN